MAIVLQLCYQISRKGPASRVTPAVSASTVSIDADGAVAVSGGAPGEDDQTVSLAGRLLVELLDHSAAALEGSALPRLRATALRAASGGQEAFGSASQLASALRRFGPKYGEAQAVQALFERWAERRGRPTTPRLQVSEPSSRSRAIRAMLVGVTLLVLAGVTVVLLNAEREAEPPVVVPVSKPTPALPRREPAWELLRRSERLAADQAPRTRPVRQSVERRELAIPLPETAVPDR